MGEPNRAVTRRRMLELSGGSVAVANMAGLSAASDDGVDASVGFDASASDGRVEVNVGFDGTAGRAATVEAASDVKREFAFDAMTIEVPEQAVSRLENHPNVRYVEENGELHALDKITWGYDRIDADKTTASGFTGAGADVAIIDSGIDATHPDLTPNLGNGICYVDCSGSPGWHDPNGHGTHVAGIVAAAQNGQGVIGVAPEATIHAVKVIGNNGSGSYADVAAGIEWSANEGHDVANLSLGGPYSQVVEDACEYAYCEGVLLVGAAGNNGPCTGCVSFPGALDEVIAVGAIDSSDTLASFSSTGPEVELVAPGVDIYSTYANGGYTTFSGTSMATPYVSGVGALLAAKGHSNLSARVQLCKTAEDIGLSLEEQGFGLVDAENAVL